jgi:hypothetical protein
VDISGSSPIVRDTTKTISGNTYVVITDLPVKVTKTVPPLCDSTAQVPYRLQVSLSGYTNSYQVFNNLKDMDGNPSTVDPLTGDFCGKTYFDDFSRVGLLPTANLNFILDWNDPTVDVNPDSPSTNPDADLDMYLWLPPNAGGTDLDGVVGTGGSWDGIDPKLVAYIPEIGPAHNNKFLGMGTLLDPSVTGYPFSPYAVHNFDGGFQLGRDSYGNAVAPVESLTIKAGSKISTAPYFLPRYSGLYTLMVTDYSYPGWYAGGSSPATSSYLLRESTDPRYTAAIVRVWSTGKLVTSVRISQSTKNTLNQPTCSGSQRDWWKVLTINGATLTTVNTCDGGNAGGFIPYGN